MMQYIAVSAPYHQILSRIVRFLCFPEINMYQPRRSANKDHYTLVPDPQVKRHGGRGGGHCSGALRTDRD